MPRLKNARHEAFAQARAAGRSIDAAYVEAGYKPNRGNAARLNANEGVSERMGELQDAAAERAEATGADVVREFMRVGLSDIRQAFDADGNLLPVHKLPDDFARAVSSVKVTHKATPEENGNTQIIAMTELKLWDKNSALEKLGRYLRIFDEADEENPATAILKAIMGGARSLPVTTAGDK